MNSPDNHKSFLEHLEELRWLIFRIIFAVALLLPAAFFFADDIIRFMLVHSCPPDFALRYFSPMEPLFVKIKISLLAAFVIALPYIAYRIWKFVVPALYPNERRRVKQLAFSSWLLFMFGIVFCFSFIIPAMMRFSLSMQSSELQPAIGLSNYITLAGMLLLGFGIMFQLPIVVFFLALSGIIKIETMKKLRAIVLIIILTLSALLTPPDIFSQLMMAVPTYLLFELSLLFSAMAIRGGRVAGHNETEDIPIDIGDDDPPPPQESARGGDDFFQSDKNNKCYRRSAAKRKLRYMSKR